MDYLKRIEDLEAELAELKKEVEEKNENTFPKKYDSYFYIGNYGQLTHKKWLPSEDYTDEQRLSIGNVFKTYEEAAIELERLKVLAELKTYTEPFNKEKAQNGICFDHECGCLDRYPIHKADHVGALCFNDSAKVEEAIQVVGEDRIKKYIFGVTTDEN